MGNVHTSILTPPFNFFTNQNDTENFKKHHGENSLRYVMDTGVCVDSEEGLEGWKSAWDIKTVSGGHHGSEMENY